MASRESLELPIRSTIWVTELGIINVRPVDTIEDAVFRRQKHLQFWIFHDQVVDEVQGPKSRVGGPMQSGYEEPFGKSCGAPGRDACSSTGPWRKSCVEGAEEEIGDGGWRWYC